MGEKEEKTFVSVDKIKPETKNIIYLTLIVITFALFFVTYIALNNAEGRCFDQFDNAMQVISNDPCMSECLNPEINYALNITNIYVDMEEYNEN